MNTQPESHYFEFQASWGLTKHMGGREATKELIEACRIDENSYVLDVGSGVGITPCILAEKYGQEYARVTRPGGYVGINEATWIQAPPPELKQYLYTSLGHAEFLSPGGWKQLLINAGLKEVEAGVYQTNTLQQWKSEVRQMDIRDYLGAWSKLVSVIIKNPEARQWVKQIAMPPKSIFHLFKYFGYGLYFGMKHV